MSGEVDPFVFFNVMFGSTLVEPYIGELWLAQQAHGMMNDDNDITTCNRIYKTCQKKNAIKWWQNE